MMERRVIDELIRSGSLGSGDWRGIKEVKPSLHVKTPIHHDIGEWKWVIWAQTMGVFIHGWKMKFEFFGAQTIEKTTFEFKLIIV
jgi:hypothetical protein